MYQKLRVAFIALVGATVLLASCTSDAVDSAIKGESEAVVTFSLQKSFEEDTLTRAAVQRPAPQRAILPDGMLVDATLIDEGGTSGTRATTTYEPITQGTGMAFICSGTTIVSAQNISVDEAARTISIRLPETGAYTVYLYLNEDKNLTLSDASVTTGNINNVTLAERPLGSKDDYVKVTNVSASNTPKTTPITFTPLGSEIRVTMSAGVAPLTGFETTVTDIQAADATGVHVADGSCTISSTPGGGQNLNFADRYDADNIPLYATTMTSGGARFFSRNQSGKQTAVLTIRSISGASGVTDDTSVKKTAYAEDNTMKFTYKYVNGHRYNLLLNLATPIYGYQEVNPTTHAATGIVQPDVKDVDGAKYSGAAAWPCPNGRPQYYAWDADTQFPTTGSVPAAGSSSAYKSTPVTSDPENPGTHVAGYSCKICPTYNQITWYLSAGTFWDASRWYCPNGFLNNNVKTTDKKDYVVHTGGCWFKKHAKIDGFKDTAPATAKSNLGGIIFEKSYTAKVEQRGKPGITKLLDNSDADEAQQNPNNWFFLPAAGTYFRGNLFYYGSLVTNYWSSTPYTPGQAAFRLSFSGIAMIYPFVQYSDRQNGCSIWSVQ